MNHYELLGVPKAASQSEIKAAFRKKVKRVHPDLNPGMGDQAFVQLNEAYEVLSDVHTRNLYDLYLEGEVVKTEINTVSPEHRYREKYKWKRAQAERERMAHQTVYKQKFYRHLRGINMGIFVISLLFSLDFYLPPNQLEFQPSEVIYDARTTQVCMPDGSCLVTSDYFLGDYQLSKEGIAVLTQSSLLSIPMRIKMKDDEDSYLVKGSIYVFGNGIGFLLFLFSLIVVANREYTDARLTFGVFSAVIMIWTLAMILVYM